MVVAIKEHVLTGIMQQSLKCRYRLAFEARQCRFRVSSVSALTSRTAGYGPVRPVVWEGVAVRLLPIPIGGFRSNPITTFFDTTGDGRPYGKPYFAASQ